MTCLLTAVDADAFTLFGHQATVEDLIRSIMRRRSNLHVKLDWPRRLLRQQTVFLSFNRG